jgi:Electron transfer flavoprotein, alpha subunit
MQMPPIFEIADIGIVADLFGIYS